MGVGIVGCRVLLPVCLREVRVEGGVAGGGDIRTRGRCRGHGRRRGRGVRCRRRRGVVEGRREVVVLAGGVEGMVVGEGIEMETMVADIGIGRWVITAAGTGMGIGAGRTAGRL